jgi:hypothetical protein
MAAPGLNRMERGRLLLGLDRFLWSGKAPPLNVMIAEARGKRPVREFLYEA